MEELDQEQNLASERNKFVAFSLTNGARMQTCISYSRSVPLVNCNKKMLNFSFNNCMFNYFTNLNLDIDIELHSSI